MGRWAKELRNHFAAGLLVLLPIYLSVLFIYTVATWIDRPVQKILLHFMPPEKNIFFGAGLIITLLIILFAGVLTRFILGRKLIGLFERILERVPVLSRVYIAVRHVIHTLLGRKKNVFEKVVLFEYPRKGIWTVGFVTSEDFKETLSNVHERLIAVFVPTVPNPTSGFFIFIPEAEIYSLDMNVEEGLKLVVSGGAIGPPATLLNNPPLPLISSPKDHSNDRVPETTAMLP